MCPASAFTRLASQVHIIFLNSFEYPQEIRACDSCPSRLVFFQHEVESSPCCSPFETDDYRHRRALGRSYLEAVRTTLLKPMGKPVTVSSTSMFAVFSCSKCITRLIHVVTTARNSPPYFRQAHFSELLKLAVDSAKSPSTQLLTPRRSRGSLQTCLLLILRRIQFTRSSRIVPAKTRSM